MRAEAAAGATTKTPAPPFRECPAIGADQSCGILIYITDAGTQVISDQSQGPYDGGDDTLVGVLNASGKSLSSLALSSNTGIFGFDGDGICSYSGWAGDAKCPYGPTSYEGPGTAFGTAVGNTGTVVFSNKLGPGAVSYFGLENALTQANLTNTRSYAALGDSYSAGVGTENSSFSSACDRGPQAWPMTLGKDGGLLISGNPQSSTNSFFACSGATSVQELHGDKAKNQPNQVHELETYAAANGTPGLVTLTAGGNDMKFADVLTKCWLIGGPPCASVLRGAISYLTTGQASFVKRLKELYEGAAKAAGSGSRVEAVGYPRIFPPSLGWLDLFRHCDWLATVPSGLNLIHQVTTDLNNDIRLAASRAHVGYMSTESALVNHELCTGKAWVADLGPINAAKKIAGHPLVPGQEAIASAVLQDLRAAGAGFARVRPVRASGSVSGRISSAVNPQAQGVEEPLKIAVAEAPGATLGTPYLGYLAGSGGAEPYTWSVSGGALPAGMSLDPATGVISGEATTAKSSKFTVTLTDSGTPTPAKVSRVLTVVASAPPSLSMINGALPVATVGQQYSAALETTGGKAPVSWALESGRLPAGLSLDPETGIISGTPTTAGNATMTVRATDSAEPAQNTTAKLTLSAVAETEPLGIATTGLPGATAGSYYRTQLNSTGGTAPIARATTGGALPEGLTLDASSGEIGGLPTSSGEYTVTITATDRSAPTPRTVSTELALTVAAGPSLSVLTTSIPEATQGSEYVASLNATGGVQGYSWQITSASLPPGLTLDTASGTIEGTPAESGSFTFTAAVSDGSTPTPGTSSRTYTMIVAASSPSMSFVPSEATVNAPYSYTPAVMGGVPPYSWSIAAGGLPAGLTLDLTTGTISGTPTATGTSAVTLQVADSSEPAAQSVTADGTLTVASAPPLQVESTALPSAVSGEPYRALIFASGGTAPLSFSITQGSLPAGLSLDPESGVISGTPSAEDASEFTVKVSDASQPSQSRSTSFTITVVAPAPVSVATTELSEADAGTNFSQTLIATGGTMPYSWSITSGLLPPGLTLSESTGEISGAPTEPGTFSFTGKVTDSGSPTPETATVSLTLTVRPSSPLDLTTTSLGSAQQGAFYDERAEAHGGIPPYSWSPASGSLPAGLSLNPQTGDIYGTPTSYGTYRFSLQVADNASPTPATVSHSYSLTVVPAPQLAVSATSLPGGAQGSYYSQSFGISGGVQPYSVTVSSGSLPEGLAIDQYGDVFGEITGAGSRTFTISVSDGSTPKAQTISRQYTIEVTESPPLEVSPTVKPFVLGQYAYQEIGVTGGVPGYTWTVISNNLPPGLAFSNGIVYGTPTKLVGGSLTVGVNDSATPTAHDVTRSVAISVVGQPPEFGRCIKVPTGSGALGNATCTAPGGEKKYEWYPAFGGAKPLVHTQFTMKIKSATVVTFETLHKAKITCTGQSGLGEYISSKTVGNVTLTFTGCSGFAQKCASAGQSEGEIVSNPLEGMLGVVTTSKEGPAKNKLGLDLKAYGGGTIVEALCGVTSVAIQGAVITPLGANKMALNQTLKWTAKGSTQKPGRFENGASEVLEGSINSQAFEVTGLNLASIQTSAEKVEANSAY